MSKVIKTFFLDILLKVKPIVFNKKALVVEESILVAIDDSNYFFTKTCVDDNHVNGT